jgi:F0F1-type ATP synthase membrane subunit b/b'
MGGEAMTIALRPYLPADAPLLASIYAAAIDELKREVSVLSVQIAEKLMQQQLENNQAQQAIIEKQLSQLN